MKMKTTRRKFFGLIAASPLAAKQAADAAAQDLIAPNAIGTMPLGSVAGGFNETKKSVSFMRKLLARGIPQWKLTEIRDELRGHTPTLDPDIACKRSWSLVAKYAAQRERLFKRRVEEVYMHIERSDIHDARRKFEQETGWWL